MFYETLLQLCKERNESLTNVLTKKLKMSGGNMTKWKDGKIPKADTISKLADYFGVSSDFLLGKTDIKKAPSQQLSEDASNKLNKLLNMVDDLSEDEWQKLMDYADLMKSARYNNKDN